FFSLFFTSGQGAAQNSVGATSTFSKSLKPYQAVTLGVPPQSPEEFNPDTGVPPIRTNLFTEAELSLRLVRMTNHVEPLPPAVFNPDPGASLVRQPEYRPFFTNDYKLLPSYKGEPIPRALQLPRTNVVSKELEPVPLINAPPYGSEALKEQLKLPRTNTVRNLPIEYKYHYENYPLSQQGIGYPPNSQPEPDRWRIGFAPWNRYTSGDTETPYETPVTMLWHPYKQSLLKGDAPIVGQDIFLDLTASSETDFDGSRNPTPSGISAARPGSADFFGVSEQIAVNNYFSFSADLFEGDTVFEPVHWAIHLQPVYNINYLQSRETGVVSSDPRGMGSGNYPPPGNGGIINPGDVTNFLNGKLGRAPGDYFGSAHTTRTKEYLSLQEAFLEFHLGDLSKNYDFIATRIGNQVYNQDFRGFLFNDINSGWRIFGNIDDNHYQYNVAAFDMREKNTDSELNTFNARDQQVVLANIYRQDFLAHGYTAQLSFLANLDGGSTHYDDNGFLVRPEPIGTVQAHSVHAYYVGWAGDGHIGPLNLSHQFYQAFGHDDFNNLAGRPVDINAQMAALELSYDRDWVRYKGSIFYASGDRNVKSGTATGFDAVVDNPNFTGGPFSYWVRQGLGFAGTEVNLKDANSLLPDLRSSKTEGQANFVNPGVLIFSLGTEMDITPKLRTFLNMNYIRFVNTESLQFALLDNNIDCEVGWDLSIGFQYRPLLTDNIIISTGIGVLLPGRGYRDIYRSITDPLSGYTSTSNPGHVDDFLYSGIIAVTFTY
ncbi:MAG TPA: hypothetical protein VFB72_05655, partial [Verrucomicrobiae bacterium]|nr:hypothetical protein [Verrucomicrobiae bacterium]